MRAYLAEGRFREVSVPLVGATAVPLAARPISEARTLAERANMLVFGERPDAALPIARRALSRDAREPLALEVIGTYHFLRNESDQARDWLARALDADRTNYRSALYLALLSSSAADRERHLLAALSAKPDLSLARQRLWTLYVEDGRAEQLRRWCDQLTKLLRPWSWINQPLTCEANQW